MKFKKTGVIPILSGEAAPHPKGYGYAVITLRVPGCRCMQCVDVPKAAR